MDQAITKRNVLVLRGGVNIRVGYGGGGDGRAGGGG